MNSDLTQEQLERLSAYLDGELQGSEREETEAFLQAHPKARAWLKEARETEVELAAAFPVSPLTVSQQKRNIDQVLQQIQKTELASPSSPWYEVFLDLFTPRRIVALGLPALALFLLMADNPKPIAPVKPPSLPKVAASQTVTPTAIPTIFQANRKPALYAQVLAKTPHSLTTTMHLEEADVDLIFMFQERNTHP